MLGSNVPIGGGLHKGFHYGRLWGCECIQSYILPSRRWSVPEISEDCIIRFKMAWKKSGIEVVVAHASLLINLAAPDDELWRKSTERLMFEVLQANRLNIPYIVLHPGSSCESSRVKGIIKVIKALNIISKKINDLEGRIRTKILLETMAGQGNMIGSYFEELAYILKNLDYPDMFGICFDTAHVFIAGYDIRGYKGCENVLKKFDEIVGIDRIDVVHLNDSRTGLGSHNDRHACIGEGKLGLQTFHAILKNKNFKKIPKIIEIPERDKKTKDNLELLRMLEKLDYVPIDKKTMQYTLEGV